MVEWWWLVIVGWLSSALGAYTTVLVRDGWHGWREELFLVGGLLLWPFLLLASAGD